MCPFPRFIHGLGGRPKHKDVKKLGGMQMGGTGIGTDVMGGRMAEAETGMRRAELQRQMAAEIMTRLW